MRRLKQTEIYIKGKQRGNCYPTTLACLLDLEIHHVPNFQLMYWDTKDMENFDKYLEWWISSSPNMSKETSNENYWNAKSTYDNLWEIVKNCWLASKGYREDHIPDINKWLVDNQNTPYMVSGKSPRDVDHVVIHQNGSLLWDVHPSGDGLLDLPDYNRYSYLKKIIN